MNGSSKFLLFRFYFPTLFSGGVAAAVLLSAIIFPLMYEFKVFNYFYIFFKLFPL